MMAAKLALIDSDLLLRLLNKSNPLPPANPTLQEINRIDNTMQNILVDDQSASNVKLKKYNELLTRYNTHAENYKKNPFGSPMKITNQTSSISTSDTDVHERWTKDTIESLPKTMQKTGRLLLNHIKNSADKIRWDEQGRIILQGTVIPHTNILDLVNSVVRSRKKAPLPSGVDQFVSALEELNTPTELLRNKPKSVATPWKAPRRQEDYVMPTSIITDDMTPTHSKTARRKKTRRQMEVDSPQSIRRLKHDDDEDDDLFQTPKLPTNWKSF